MKKISALMIILVFIISIIAVPAMAEDDYEEFGPEFQEKVKKIEKAAEKLEKLAKKFENVELDVIKQEDMTVVDQNGEGVACTFEIYYDSDEVVQFRTGDDGRYTGDFNHGKSYPGKVISFKMSQCQCVVKKIQHRVGFPGYDETIERMKVLIQDELASKGEEQAKKVGKKMVEKAFSAAGAAKLAGPFLWGVEKGAELGKPFGEMLSQGLNDVLDAMRKKNRDYREKVNEIEPASGKRITARWIDWFRTEPMLKNTWNIDVKCDAKLGEYNMDYFRDINDYMPRTPKVQMGAEPKVSESGIESESDDSEYERWQEEEARKWEAERKKQEEARRKEWERQRAEAKKKLDAEIAKVKKECPPCDGIRKLIEETKDAMDAKMEEIPGLEDAVDKAKDAKKKADKKVEREKKKVENFENPESSASSEGRTVTSTDLAIDRMVAKNAWKEYIDGDISAEQLESKWKEYDAEARAKAKEDYKKELDEKVADAEAEAAEADEAVGDAEGNAANRKTRSG